MFFKRKVDRVINVKAAEEKFAREMQGLKEEGLEPDGEDGFAMIVAAYLVFLPVALLIGGVIVLAAGLLFW